MGHHFKARFHPIAPPKKENAMKLRRSVLVFALGLTAVLVAQTAATGGTASSRHNSGQSPGAGAVPQDSLRALGSKVGIRIGTAVNTDVLAANAPYRQITADQCSGVTLENWSAADQLLKFAKTNGQLVRGHTLVWQNQLPAW